MHAKARNLARLRDAGMKVPGFIVVTSAWGLHLDDLPPSPSGRWSVRSSAPDEDAHGSAQAGRYTTFLDVTSAELPARTAEVLAQTGEAIVQAMLEPECSGVLFTANPQGIRNERVLQIGPGAGAVVTGEGTVRTYRQVDVLGLVHGDGPELSGAQLTEVWRLADELRELFGCEVDVELAWQDGELWLLQARPITTLSDDEAVVLDNSNLVESYPGLSLPLTHGFARRVYRGIYRGLARRVLGRGVELDMVTSCNGRLYYLLNNHYTAVALLPGARWLVPIWERSLGLPHRSDRTNPWRRRDRARATASLLVEFATAPRRMRQLDAAFDGMVGDFDDRLARATTLVALAELYDDLESTLVEPWAVTLVNDLHAFFWAAAVEKVAGAHAMAGVADVESMRPLRALSALAHTPGERTLDGDGEFAHAARAYVAEFGDRYLAELKLESPTFRTDPRLLLEAVESIGELPAEHEPALPAGRLARWLWQRAAEGARNREISRLHRSRIYGMVRSICLAAGELHAAARHLAEPRDVFWLEWDELFTSSDHVERVAERQRRWAGFEQLPAYPRLVFDREPFDIVVPRATSTVAELDGPLVGIGVSPGVARGPVCLVREPADARPGHVLVTVSTDPGWAFIIGQSLAVVSERGSLLSHTAIISRELGTPLVVDVPQATSRLHDGQLVEVDGTAGTIRIIEEDA